MFSGSRLIAFREEAGLTQAELARRAGLYQTRVSDLELGVTKNPSMTTVGRLAEALGKPVGAFFVDEGGEPRTVAAPPDRALQEVLGNMPVYVPVVRGLAYAGRRDIPSDQVVDWEPMPSSWRGRYLVGVLVAGTCMVPEVWPGDTVIVEPGAEFEDREMVAIRHGGVTLIKWAVRVAGEWALRSRQEGDLRPSEETVVVGPVRRVVRKPGRWSEAG